MRGAAPVAVALAAPPLTVAAGWATYGLARTADWARWTADDAAAVGVGALATALGVRFLIDLATAWSALRRGRAVPARTGRVAAAAAASLLALLVGTGAASASTEMPPAGWLPVEHAAPAPSPSTTGWTSPFASVPPVALRVPASVPPASSARAPAAATADPAPDVTGDATAVHVVVAGDSLWRITAGLLGEDASDARIAAAWPALYRANRAVIGEDPNLITVGLRLEVPAGLGAAR